jgi:hypothetical protein
VYSSPGPSDFNFVTRRGQKYPVWRLTATSCATRWLEDGVPLHTVQAWVGHEDLEITQNYLGVTDCGNYEGTMSGPHHQQQWAWIAHTACPVLCHQTVSASSAKQAPARVLCKSCRPSRKPFGGLTRELFACRRLEGLPLLVYVSYASCPFSSASGSHFRTVTTSFL